MAHIWEKDRFYNFLVVYISRNFRRAYKRVEYTGLENIPKDGAVIFSPNHANTLMDALAVISIDEKPKVFVARADIFKNPTARKFLNYIKMMPINRIRDGVDSLKENDAIIEECVETLKAGVHFCILPEGTHRTQHGLLPLRKGIARIAYETYESVKDTMPIYIVPVGLEYEDYFDYRSRLLITVGHPIVLQDFIRAHEGLDIQKQMRQLLLLLEDKMKENIICIPSDEDYEDIWEGTNVLYGRRRRPIRTLFERMKWMQRTAKELGVSKASLRRFRKIKEWRNANGISLQSLSERKSAWRVALDILLLAVLSPIFILSTILISPALVVISIIKRSLKDKAFLNSIRFVSCHVMNPIVILLVCLALLTVLPWWACLTLFVLAYFSPIAFYDWLGGFRRVRSDLRLARASKAMTGHITASGHEPLLTEVTD